MRAQAITWAGTRTERVEEMVEFLQRRLGLSLSHRERGFVALELPNGDTVEVFDAADPDHRHLSTGPVVGFGVDDVAEGRRELEESGVELIGEIMSGGGFQWQHFRGPRRHLWESTARQDPRQ